MESILQVINHPASIHVCNRVVDKLCRIVSASMCIAMHNGVVSCLLYDRLEKWKLSVLGELKYQSRSLNSDGSIRVSTYLYVLHALLTCRWYYIIMYAKRSCIDECGL